MHNAINYKPFLTYTMIIGTLSLSSGQALRSGTLPLEEFMFLLNVMLQGRKSSHSSEASIHSSSGSTSKDSTCGAGTSPRPSSAVSGSFAEAIPADVQREADDAMKKSAGEGSSPSAYAWLVPRPSSAVRSILKTGLVTSVQPEPAQCSSVLARLPGTITAPSAVVQPVPGSSAIVHTLESMTSNILSNIITIESGGAESSSDDRK